MKKLLLFGSLFTVVMLMAAWSSPALAQEELGPFRGERIETNEPAEPENKPALSKSALNSSRDHQRDSIAVKTAPQQKADAKNENPQNDILSFNFLYYIIQRFKLSDIVD
jgi:hypothetical protein